MNIITLFCEIDNFSLDYEKWMAPQCLPEAASIQMRGRPRQLHPSEVMTLVIASIKATLGRLSTFTSNMSASIGALSSRVW